MNYWTKFFNDVYQGIYFFSAKYEPVEDAKSFLWVRARVVYYLYYMSIVLMLIVTRVKLYGPFKPNYFEVFLVVIVPYFLIYRFVVDRSLNKDIFELELLDAEKNQKMRKCIIVFIGSIFSLSVTILINYFLYKT